MHPRMEADRRLVCIDLVPFQVNRSHSRKSVGATYMHVTLSVLICMAFSPVTGEPEEVIPPYR